MMHPGRSNNALGSLLFNIVKVDPTVFIFSIASRFLLSRLLLAFLFVFKRFNQLELLAPRIKY